MVAMQLTRVGLSTLGEFSKPLIAQVSGYCLGAGLAIAVACDLRLVATGATFGIPAARLGLAYHYSEMKRLTDLVGPSSAKRLVFTADRITAGLALQLGLVDEVATAEHLNGAVQALALSIASNAPLTLKAAKRAVALALSECTEVDTTRCDEQASFCLASEDYREGLHAFQEKRRPVFRGK
jgi:enoyl-CoA hydratase/carnithine racemase